MEYHIDCAQIDSRREFHKVMAERLHFPEWYGHNLDALHDCLTAISADTRLVFSDWDHAAPFARGFRRVLEDAEKENPRLEVRFL